MEGAVLRTKKDLPTVSSSLLSSSLLGSATSSMSVEQRGMRMYVARGKSRKERGRVRYFELRRRASHRTSCISDFPERYRNACISSIPFSLSASPKI
jgi:hypothetical protein